MDRELLGALADGAAAVTAGAHLARSLRQAYDARQQELGRQLWPEPRIAPWEEWLAEQWMALQPGWENLAYLATEAQILALWRRQIGEDAGWDAAALARQAADAWDVSRAWRVAPAGGTAECDAFARWAAAMEQELRRRNWITAAQLPDRLRDLLAAGAIAPWETGAVIPVGFAPLTPQQAEFFAAWQAAGGQVRELPQPGEPVPRGAARQAPFGGETAENEAAAAWARRQLEAGRRRIGIIVLDLARRREALERAFTLALEPAAWLLGGGVPATFHITLGPPLAEQPAIAAGLRVLRLLAPGAALPVAEAEAVLRSPYLAGGAAAAGESARSARSRAVAALTAARQMEATLGGVLRAASAANADALAQRLRRMRAAAAAWPARQSAAAWAESFSAVLAAGGWPGEELSSAEHQAVGRWNDLLDEFSGVAAVVPPLTAQQAAEQLAAQAAAQAFQPQAPAAPVEILSPEATPGLSFEAVWMLGAHAAAWPPPASLNPWLPAAAQRAAGLPRISPDAAREWAESVTHRLCAGVQEAVFSFAPPDGAAAVLPSSLVRDLPPLGAATAPAWPAGVPAAAQEPIPDQPAPVATPENGEPTAIAGGAAVFTDQSLCPFRAFAHHRLHASGLDSPAPGLDAAARGQLLHQALYRIFPALADADGWVTVPEAAKCRQLAAAAAAQAVQEMAKDLAKYPAMVALRSPAFAALETERLTATVAKWLVEVEAARGRFAVRLAEQQSVGEIGGLAIRWRADRVDRLLDEGGGETIAILDFKSSRQHGRGDWAGERPKDLQLPLYAQFIAPPPAALAFAVVQPGKMGFAGAAAAEGLLPGCKPYDTPWAQQLAAWRQVLEDLAAEFLAGGAAIAPQPGACDLCDLAPLCRIGELGGAPEVDEGGEEGEAGGDGQ
jgi:ATP-dependent helicase/nuclease subunit B